MLKFENVFVLLKKMVPIHSCPYSNGSPDSPQLTVYKLQSKVVSKSKLSMSA